MTDFDHIALRSRASFRFWIMLRHSLGRSGPPTKSGIVDLPHRDLPTTLDVDVLILTNCASGGGNAATTITEARCLEAAGFNVAIAHIGIRRSKWKRNWIYERYLTVADKIIPLHLMGRITCRTLIARAPRMIMHRDFGLFADRIEPDHAILVINNAATDEKGRISYSWPDLHKRVASLNWPSVELCPAGPLVRAESDSDLKGTGVPSQLSARDWPPVIEQSTFRFSPRPALSAPIVIGRHGRDHFSKWPSTAADILAAYPGADPDIRVSILGGADRAIDLIGEVPANWTVQPFGFEGVEDYLESLDVFVNFPSPERHEAFGRTIVEAIFSGLPVILPPRFEATFGDLAFYCKPQDVRRTLRAIAADDAGRLAHLDACRTLAADLYGTPSLVRRLRDGSAISVPRLPPERAAWRAAILSGL